MTFSPRNEGHLYPRHHVSFQWRIRGEQQRRANTPERSRSGSNPATGLVNYSAHENYVLTNDHKYKIYKLAEWANTVAYLSKLLTLWLLRGLSDFIVSAPRCQNPWLYEFQYTSKASLYKLTYWNINA